MIMQPPSTPSDDLASLKLLPINKRSALAVGSSAYFTGEPCPNGHMEKRRTSNGKCLQCGRESAFRHHRRNRDHSIKRMAEWRLNNAERTKEYRDKYIEDNAVAIKA